MENNFSSEYIDEFLKKKLLDLLQQRKDNFDFKGKISINTNLSRFKPGSIELIQYITYVEKTFEIFFEESELLRKNFSNIKKIRNSILDKLENKKRLLIACASAENKA